MVWRNRNRSEGRGVSNQSKWKERRFERRRLVPWEDQGQIGRASEASQINRSARRGRLSAEGLCPGDANYLHPSLCRWSSPQLDMQMVVSDTHGRFLRLLRRDTWFHPLTPGKVWRQDLTKSRLRRGSFMWKNNYLTSSRPAMDFFQTNGGCKHPKFTIFTDLTAFFGIFHWFGEKSQAETLDDNRLNWCNLENVSFLIKTPWISLILGSGVESKQRVVKPMKTVPRRAAVSTPWFATVLFSG